MSKKRILVVDDSCLYQRILSDVIDSGRELEVVGVAANGKIALDMIDQLKPDLITLDILMPEMDGIQTMIELRKRWPSIRTVMVSSLTSEGSDAALDAMALGASEYVAKPSSTGGIENIRAQLSHDLLPKIEALCGIGQAEVKVPSMESVKENVSVVCAEPVKTSARNAPAGGVQIIAIGVSTGGPDALAKVLSKLPADIGVPIVIVQHMPAQFTAKLATRLNALSALNVVEARIGDKLRSGTVYIAPGDYHMVLDSIQGEVVVTLNKDAEENSCRPSVDPLFRSIPPIYGSKCLGVVLTGMGADGFAGSQVLSEAGCTIVVQDKLSSVVWGMPKLVAQAGLAHQEVDINQMAETITGLVFHPQRLCAEIAANSDLYKQSGASGGIQ